jgi:excisionase family DNA binding protein
MAPPDPVPPPSPPDWLSPAAAAAWLHIGRRTIYRAIQRGELRASLVNGKDFRIYRPWLITWAELRADMKPPRPRLAEGRVR